MLSRGETVQRVALGVWPREDAEKVIAQLSEAGLEPKVICVGSPADADSVRFDFRPSLDEAQAPSGRIKGNAILWSVVAALILLNGIGLILRDIRRVEAMREAVAAQSGGMTLVTGLRRQVEGEHKQREDLLNQRSTREPCARWMRSRRFCRCPPGCSDIAGTARTSASSAIARATTICRKSCG
ncbi:hypothetical protein E6W36_11885 [Hankyongella ginsenosidimutans]|uniref:Uncharacterized protein n=1 Tax=Hankyongella ginsenosidimutans TaxID=1763828 RepID=A0A4D7BX32_9SPHN|nr:hypothetical protein [Hankyongella ginsenosidimutans]QCI79959.1 hypothetical protein E6W36_11885 [Hankyongella ginsenosidimutans]